MKRIIKFEVEFDDNDVRVMTTMEIVLGQALKNTMFMLVRLAPFEVRIVK